MADTARTVAPAPANKTETSGNETSTGSTSTEVVKSGLRGLPFDEQERMLAPPAGPGDPKPTGPSVPSADFQTQLATWMPAVTKVCDPVAFMTSADAKGNKGRGNYAQAIADKGAKGGFFEQAKGELARLGGEVAGYLGAKADLDAGQRDELARLGELLSGYRDLYGAIQATGMSAEGAKDPAKRAAVAQRVQAAVDATRGKVTGLNPEVLGLAALQRIAQSFDDIALFVESWSEMSGDPNETSASPYMWGAFLQTVERYRTILNQYDELETRGGDATGTSKMAVKETQGGGTAQTSEEFKTAQTERGGTMALALESYSMKAESIAAYQKQVAEMQQRVNAGEFATQEEAVAAFRKHVGGGGASEAFYLQLDELAKGTWSAAQGDQLVVQETQKLADTKTKYDQANKSLDGAQSQGQKSVVAYQAHQDHAENQDKFKADASWESCQSHKQKAEELLAQSRALLARGDEFKEEALALHAEAMAALETAKLHLSHVDPSLWPQLAPGVDQVEGQILASEAKLSENAETAKQLQIQKEKIQTRATNMERAADAYDPKKVEVKAPLSEVGGEKGTLEHYTSFEIEISGKVSPIVELFGSAKGTSGNTLEAAELWTFAEGEWSAGVRVDLWLFELSVAYIGALRYDAKGDHSSDEVVRLGDEERARWEASKEIGQKKYDEKLKNAFDVTWQKGLKAYAPLKQKAGKVSGNRGARKDFDKALEPAAEELAGTQDMLEQLSASAFFDVSGNFMDYIRTKLLVRDGDQLAADVRALRDVPDEELAAETQDSEDRFTADNRKTDDKIQERFSQVVDTENNPDVKFEASGSWEVGATAGGGGVSIGATATATTTVSDGDEEKFNYDEEDSMAYAVEAEFGSSTAKVELITTDDAWEIGVGGSLGFQLAGEEEEEEVTKTAIDKGRLVWKSLAGDDPAALRDALKEWYGELIEDIESKVKVPKPSFASKAKVELDFNFTRAKDEESGDMYWQKGTFGIGFATEVSGGADMGVMSVEAKYTSGMKATFVLFENAGPSADNRAAAAIGSQSGAMSAVSNIAASADPAKP